MAGPDRTVTIATIWELADTATRITLVTALFVFATVIFWAGYWLGSALSNNKAELVAIQYEQKLLESRKVILDYEQKLGSNKALVAALQPALTDPAIATQDRRVGPAVLLVPLIIFVPIAMAFAVYQFYIEPALFNRMPVDSLTFADFMARRDKDFGELTSIQRDKVILPYAGRRFHWSGYVADASQFKSLWIPFGFLNLVTKEGKLFGSTCDFGPRYCAPLSVLRKGAIHHGNWSSKTQRESNALPFNRNAPCLNHRRSRQIRRRNCLVVPEH
jgi:hypothetical protein